MATERVVARMSDTEVLDRFGTGADPASQGFDAATQARVWATELVRARARMVHYRALYAALLDAGRPYLLENLDDEGDGSARPVKLIFSDDPADVQEAEARPDLAAWSEETLLARLVRERAILDFFAGVLDEFLPTVTGR